MKRLYISLSLVAVLVALGFGSLLYTQTACRDMTRQIDRAISLRHGPQDALSAELAALEEIWMRHRARMLHHIHHEKLDLIGMELARAKSGVGETGHSVTGEALSTMRWLVESVYENEQVRLDNIL